MCSTHIKIIWAFSEKREFPVAIFSPRFKWKLARFTKIKPGNNTSTQPREDERILKLISTSTPHSSGRTGAEVPGRRSKAVARRLKEYLFCHWSHCCARRGVCHYTALASNRSVCLLVTIWWSIMFFISSTAAVGDHPGAFLKLCRSFNLHRQGSNLSMCSKQN